MKAVIKIEMDNAAFEDLAGSELASILRHFANQVRAKNYYDLERQYFVAMDVNGNRVGIMKII